MISLEGIRYVPPWIVPCHSISTVWRIVTSMGVHGWIYFIFTSTVESAYVQGGVGVCVCGGVCVCVCVIWRTHYLFCLCAIFFLVRLKTPGILSSTMHEQLTDLHPGKASWRVLHLFQHPLQRVWKSLCGRKAFWSLFSFTNDTQPPWRPSCWIRAYVDGMEMPQQTEDWHRALQGTPPQMGILEGQPRSKLWLALSPIPCSIYSSVLCWSKYAQLDLAAYNDTAQKSVQHWLNSI